MRKFALAAHLVKFRAKRHFSIEREFPIPKPAIPENCCMSGCAVCVFDLYEKEVQKWKEQRGKWETENHASPAEDVAKDAAKDEIKSPTEISLAAFREFEKSSK